MFPKLRFKKFDGDWTAVTLESLAEVERGKFSVRPRNDPRYFGGEMPFIQTGDVTGSDVYLKGYTQTLNDDGIRVSKVFPADTILITIAANIGDTTITQYPVACPDSVVAIQPKQDKVNTIFLKNVIDLQKDNLDSQATQNAQKNINLQVLKPLKLIVPSKEEQNKIASFLSAVDEKISQLTQKLELLSQYKQGMMQKLFSQQIRFKADDGSEFGEWEKTKFLDLMVDLWDYRGKTPKKLGMDWGDGEIQSLSALNIKKGFIDFDADCHLGSEKLYKTWMNKGDLEKDDIIFTMEAPLGNVALIPDDRKYILSQRVVCFKTNKKMVDNKFIFQLILSDQFQSRIEELATGTTAKGINQKSMQKIEVALPPTEEQTKIANFLSAIDQKIEVVAQQIEQAKQWKKGLLQNMFI
ncbi:restriction endonuclease subunit S [Acinetobacter indicus]|uniref:restriction endonuclease subunit S n=1 Tax=Acinetobacter indicus TaxID=756892 RepID=UPI000CEBB921|nr:restriction endonuclease subunit S [Acinetobacter indicus]